MKRIIYIITILPLFIIISCEEPYQPSSTPSTPSFDELFYQKYSGISADIFDSSKNNESFFIINNINQKSFFEIKKDNTFNLRFCGHTWDSNDSIDYQTSGKIEISSKSSFQEEDGWFYGYWNLRTKITIGSSISYVNCRLYIPYGDGNDVELAFVNKSLQIKINDQKYFLLHSLSKNYPF